MEIKQQTVRLILSATSVMFLLLLPLLYIYSSTVTVFFFTSNVVPYDQRKQQYLSNWRGKQKTRIVDVDDDELGMEEDKEQLDSFLRRLVRGEDRTEFEATGIACHSDAHTDVCVANGPVRIDMSTLDIYAPFTSQGMPRAKRRRRLVRPYARKQDQGAMGLVSQLQILLLQGNITITPPACDHTHTVPAIVFSTGGYTGNQFHEFNDVIIPLFITCRHFQLRLRFVVTDYKPWMITKFNRILSHLSPHEVLNPAVNQGVHCFPGAVVGLHYHGNLAVESTNIPGGYSMPDFMQFLREAYSLKIQQNTPLAERERPVLILVSRSTSRMFLNEDDMVSMMEGLGFRVVVATPYRMSNLTKFAKVLNSCSVLVGAHGAGLANALFMHPGAVLVQVVPLGLDWVSANYFGEPATQMGLKYVEYKIEPEESSLLGSYGRDHQVITNPESMFLKGYMVARAVYIDRQNLNINLVRFREILLEARRLLGHKAPLA